MLDGTIKQSNTRTRPALAVHTQNAASSSSSSFRYHQRDDSEDGPTPIALPDDDDDDEDLALPQAPFQQMLRGKASFDSLTSNPTMRSQTSLEIPPKNPARQAAAPGAGNVGDGLKGFQFPLNKAMMPARPPPLVRGASAAPMLGAGSPSPTRPGLPRMHSAQPNLQTESPSSKPVRPQISINLPPRPGMMRHASAAVLGGRAQAQAQAQALAAVDESPTSPVNHTGGGGASRPPIGLGVAVGTGMSRSRSGSKTGDGSVALRDLMNVSVSPSQMTTQMYRGAIPDKQTLRCHLLHLVYRIYRPPHRQLPETLCCATTSPNLPPYHTALTHYKHPCLPT